ncbi:RNA polymerase subunit sigma [Bacillus thuringiensis serovar silo]|uniref:sigma-70 family RNA polymerase sigma factor n=1 Tax=Bacillus thuringiensis TaxID=1428 RepID=UPI000A374752|nr:sigma-70 family RNA polymerase sigma factor [Bacillus thuringiensis]MEB9339262.1 sigma-70 family RNA polymerase sigma factor [Bacillus cereus]MED3270644.1 sigma-70 family RNA polymerase sigma factor [Bacillus thuringiensis]OTW60807.1 RNA polymerase subunit sigma [Bacillus thuringiensis serovar silo]OTW69047.1 RNA polymerase subunit sigma [Bacillus thuringiensis serovar toguchini]
MSPNDLFEEKQHLVFAAIKQHFGSFTNAKQIAQMNQIELDDLIQVGFITLWEACLKYDPSRKETFNGYVMAHMKWRMSDEINRKKLIKLTCHVTPEEVEKFHFQSIDLHCDGEIVNEFFAISDIDVEEDVMKSIEFEEVMNPLDEKEKFVLMNKSYGFTDDEIGSLLGKSRPVITQIKHQAFFKINPNYKKTGNKSLLSNRKIKRNRQLGLTV